ncbi:MAG: nuclear transport factor 2 family protein [Nitrosomonadaceae bacterium]|nr:nuclear transport factor 2 family protein [Nitrosomonadaceae bacterium]
MKYDLNFFLGLEIQVWEALKNGDKNANSRLLSDDFLGVYETGLGSKEDHLELLRNGPIISCYEIGSSQLIQLGPEIASLTYSATATFLRNEGEDTQVLLYITSIWARRLNKWVNIFSQDTKGNTHY